MNLERVVNCRIDSRFAGMTALDFLTSRFTYHDRDGWLEKMAQGELTVNGSPLLPDTVLADGMTITYKPINLAEPDADTSYEVVYEDEYLAVVNKSGNLPVHPSGIFFRNTLWRLLMERYGQIHLVNRLDRETSGLVIAAKDSKTAGLMAKKGFYKEYLALVLGVFDREIKANGFLVPDKTSAVRKKRRFVSSCEDGESASTLFLPEKSAGNISLVKALPETGRMHQIRATLFSLGYPLLGDKLYGVDDSCYLKQRSDSITEEDFLRLGMRRQALHAAFLRFVHPRTGKITECKAEIPLDFIVK